MFGIKLGIKGALRVLVVGGTLYLSGVACTAAPTSVPTPTPTSSAPTPTMTPTGVPTVVAAPTATPTGMRLATPTLGVTPSRGGTLTMVDTEDAGNCDIAQRSTRTVVRLTGPIDAFLVGRTYPDLSGLTPEVAERWNYADGGRTLTLFLRKDVKFSDGTPVTAADVVFSSQRLSDPPTGVVSTRRDFYLSVEKWEALDDYTVRVTYRYPNSTGLQVLSNYWHAIYQSASVSKSGNRKSCESAIGAGPFKLKSVDRDVRYVFDRNPHYFVSGKPYIDTYQVLFVADEATRSAALRTGRIDGIDAAVRMERDAIATLQAEQPGKFTTGGVPRMNSRGLSFNVARPGPWQDVRVRQAINMAIDREAAVALIPDAGTVDQSVGGFLPPTGSWDLSRQELFQMPGYRKPKAQDLADARKLLADAGFPNGFELTVLFRPEAVFTRYTVPVLVDQLSAIGITLKADVQTAAVVTERTALSQYDVIGSGLGSNNLDDPSAVLDQLVTGTVGAAGYSNPAFDELVLQIRQATDTAARKALVDQASRILFNDLPSISLFWEVSGWAMSNQVQNIPTFGRGAAPLQGRLQYADVWLSR
ncbi:MAG: ABC transporter substrate-binding protein [Chloroflexi bacterium]|nr:ABC transporter substrate-binding protein [Chloroflexota bacterium]